MTQIHQFKNKIEFSEARFEAIAQTASDSIIISDEYSIIIFANKKTYEIFGYPEGSLIGSDLGILMPEKYRQGHRAGVKRFITTGNPKLIGYTIEIEGLRKDDSIFPLELSLSAWKEEGAYFFSGIIRDVTEKKEATIKLQNQQKKLEVANKELHEAQHTIQQQNEELATALEELKSAEEELRATNDELEYRVERRTRELAQSERKVKQKEEQLLLITDAVPVLISYLNSDFTYDFVNKAYEKLLKVKREEVLGRHIKEVVGLNAFNNVKSLIEKALNGETVNHETLQDYGKVGKKWVKISLVPHKMKGKVVGVFSLVEDITEFKNIQLELEEKNRALERTNIDLDNFVYTASHDLRSPISNLEGIIKLLNKSVPEKVNPKERKMLEMMDISIQKLRKTIGDLVEITKIQKESEDAVEEPVRFEEIAKDVKEDIYRLIQENNAVIKEDFKVEETIYKKSNLRSILYNLLSNAIKYRDPNRPLEVEVKSFVQDGFVNLSVKDNGLGLNQNQQKKLFILFQRLHKHVEGTGIGLFMIKRIIENNRGRIEVKSEEGKGTEFLVFLTKTLDKKV